MERNINPILLQLRSYRQIKVMALGGRGTSQQGNSSSSASSNISNKDLFMTATVNKTKVHEQEAILLTYKSIQY